MAETTILKKLLVKPGQKMAVINAPAGYLEGLGPLPEQTELSIKITGRLDFVQVFVKSAAEVTARVPAALRGLKPGGLLWICYPKGGFKAGTDLNRDILWKAMEKFGQAGVSLIAIDGVWSAMRFRPVAEVGK